MTLGRQSFVYYSPPVHGALTGVERRGLAECDLNGFGMPLTVLVDASIRVGEPDLIVVLNLFGETWTTGSEHIVGESGRSRVWSWAVGLGDARDEGPTPKADRAGEWVVDPGFLLLSEEMLPLWISEWTPLLADREFAEGREALELREPASKRPAGAEPVERIDGLM